MLQIIILIYRTLILVILLSVIVCDMFVCFERQPEIAALAGVPELVLYYVLLLLAAFV
jgi:hypothetical protein